MTLKTVLAVTFGLLGAVWRQRTLRDFPSTIHEEAWTAWFGWALLYIGCRVYSWKRSTASAYQKEQDGQWLGVFPLRNLPTLVLAAVAVVSQVAQSRGIFAFMMPLVILAIPLVNLAIPPQTDMTRLLEAAQQTEEEQFEKPHALHIELSRQSPRLLIAVNTALCLLLAGTVQYERALAPVTIAFSLIFLLGRTATFVLIPRISQGSDLRLSAAPCMPDWNLIEKTSLYALAFSTSLLLLSQSFSYMPTLADLGSATAAMAWWLAIFTLCADRLSITATTLEILAISFDRSMQSEKLYQMLFACISATIALWQVVASVPRDNHRRNWLYFLALIPVLGLLHDREQYRSVSLGRQEYSSGLHPVEHLVLNARTHLSEMLNRQSQSLDQATKEYKRRYGREPPSGFDRWFELAQGHNFTLVDEFDVMMQSLEPFWGASVSSLRTLCSNALTQSPESLLRYEIRDNRLDTSGGSRSSWFGESANTWLPSEWLQLLPDMTLAINVYDEPSVCVPRDTLDRAMRLAGSTTARSAISSQASQQDLAGKPRFLDLAKQDAWEAMTLSCPVLSPARNFEFEPPEPGEPLPFIRNMTKSRDICEHSELQNLEGFLLAPETLRLTHSLVPIWSQGKPSLFNDILFPSPYYRARSSDYKETEDQDWENKNNQIYWVGAATGGHATEANWKHMHRQRLALLTQSGSTQPIRLLREAEPGVWNTYATNMSEVGSLFSTRIMGVTPQCERAACDAEKEAFGIGEEEVKDSIGAGYAHRFLLDLDGNSFSGRFYRLLHSKSTVIKQSMFVEWHDDRLIPWVHYVPVSTGFEEMPELVRFLATTDKGQEISQRIAKESKIWAETTLRNVDLQLVWLRMLLEYGRVVSPAREF